MRQKRLFGSSGMGSRRRTNSNWAPWNSAQETGMLASSATGRHSDSVGDSRILREPKFIIQIRSFGKLGFGAKSRVKEKRALELGAGDGETDRIRHLDAGNAGARRVFHQEHGPGRGVGILKAVEALGAANVDVFSTEDDPAEVRRGIIQPRLDVRHHTGRGWSPNRIRRSLRREWRRFR